MKPTFLALALVALFGPCLLAQQPSYDDRHRISVTGDADVRIAPDRIVITLGVDTRDLNLLVAKQQNDAIVRRGLAAVKALDVSDRDIQTDQLSISQRFGDRQQFQGYTVRNMFVVTISDPAKVEQVISSALESGVNYLLRVDFQTSELKKFREQARELAVKAAREKAEKMALTLGQRVGNPIQIDEDQRYGGTSYYSSWSGTGWDSGLRGSSGVSQNVIEAGGGDVADTIALGKVSIRASVRVIFELAR